jgi:hypothetical protein
MPILAGTADQSICYLLLLCCCAWVQCKLSMRDVDAEAQAHYRVHSLQLLFTLGADSIDAANVVTLTNAPGSDPFQLTALQP